jgi:hypothetical protein
MASTPYVVRTSDYLTAIAARNGTTVDDILADPQNADIKAGHPEILAPLDVVYLPAVKPSTFPLTTGSTNTFVADVPTVDVNVTLLDEDGQPLAGKSVTTDPVVSDTPLSTDGSGLLTFTVTIDVTQVDVSIDGTLSRFSVCIGNLDPPDTDSGLASRLRQLGHLGDEDDFVAARPWVTDVLGAGPNDHALALGVASFQSANGQTVTGDPTDDGVRSDIAKAHGC